MLLLCNTLKATKNHRCNLPGRVNRNELTKRNSRKLVPQMCPLFIHPLGQLHPPTPQQGPGTSCLVHMVRAVPLVLAAILTAAGGRLLPRLGTNNYNLGSLDSYQDEFEHPNR